ncbi:hypothetical protein [Parasitella parasitica]|uniref:Uncharacterized protein n=1 Tax=Parasitella parasitica TaxID=35722 RepID=A0A0B7MYZ6_9FUNG|nr:hypothetical protein [Parasitella parasitica]
MSRRSSRRRSASPKRALDRNSRTKSPLINDYKSSDEENESITLLKVTIAAIKSIIDPEDFELIIKQQALMVKERTRLARDITDIKDEIKTIRPALQGSQSTAQAASICDQFGESVLSILRLNHLMSDEENDSEDDTMAGKCVKPLYRSELPQIAAFFFSITSSDKFCLR